MSRILLVSDIHANLAALEAVLSDAEERGPLDAVWSLGDVIGYGPQPSECLMRLRQIGSIAVNGNHELAVLGKIPVEEFNVDAARAVLWTSESLSDEAREFVENLPLTQTSGAFTLVHGSPRSPAWEYVTDEFAARENVAHLETPNCVLGHTHVPAAFCVSAENGAGEDLLAASVTLDAAKGRWFINPGSVGQPRDRDPRAAYAILDDDSLQVSFHRVEYGIRQTQELMEQVGLPEFLSSRLTFGY